MMLKLLHEDWEEVPEEDWEKAFTEVGDALDIQSVLAQILQEQRATNRLLRDILAEMVRPRREAEEAEKQVSAEAEKEAEHRSSVLDDPVTDFYFGHFLNTRIQNVFEAIGIKIVKDLVVKTWGEIVKMARDRRLQGLGDKSKAAILATLDVYDLSLGMKLDDE